MKIVDLIAYLALLINFASMGMENMIRLRILSMIANALYVVYGIFIAAYPIVIGCCIAIVIHSYGVFKLLPRNLAEDA